MKFFNNCLFACLLLIVSTNTVKAFPQQQYPYVTPFPVRGFHLDLRIQVMKIPALKALALQLNKAGINTLVMEYEASFPYEKHPLIANRYAYTKLEIIDFVNYCKTLSIDVIPLQQSFGHLEYVLKNNRYKEQREDQKDFSQICPSKENLNRIFFTELYTELAALHPSKYIHIGGDETHLLGHDAPCKAKVAKTSVSKLYGDHIKMLCQIVIGMGKIPVLWADIALKYPDAIKDLPKEAIFVDWNYGWDLDKFGDHKKLMQSGFEIWGAVSLRSSPDNYNLTMWDKHFNNIHDFLPAARNLNYKGMMMTSWSTSGVYSAVNESGFDIVDLYAVRRVYPLSAFNMLIAAFAEALKDTTALNTAVFIEKYCNNNYGLTPATTKMFWNALKTTPYEVVMGEVKGPISLVDLLDSSKLALKTISSIQPLKNTTEFAQYLLMAEIRVEYLTYQWIEKQVNTAGISESAQNLLVKQLETLIIETKNTNKKFTNLNSAYYYVSELEADNNLRIQKMELLYNRLSKNR